MFVPPAEHLTAAQEKAEYDLHQNSLQDTAYRQFLARLYEPLQQRLAAAQQGLDFGCGPGPLLAQMLSEQGHQMNVFDIFYANTPEVLEQEYDFITCTEVIEHLARPAEVIPQLWALLRPGGWFGLMTKLVIDQAAFAAWHYKNDPSHICFYSRDSFHWLQSQLCCELHFIDKDVILLRKPGS